MLLRVHAAGSDASQRHRVHSLRNVDERHGGRFRTVANNVCNNFSSLNSQIKCGFFVNVFCVATNFLCLNTFGSLIYGLDDNEPGWLT